MGNDQGVSVSRAALFAAVVAGLIAWNPGETRAQFFGGGGGRGMTIGAGSTAQGDILRGEGMGYCLHDRSLWPLLGVLEYSKLLDDIVRMLPRESRECVRTSALRSMA